MSNFLVLTQSGLNECTAKENLPEPQLNKHAEDQGMCLTTEKPDTASLEFRNSELEHLVSVLQQENTRQALELGIARECLNTALRSRLQSRIVIDNKSHTIGTLKLKIRQYVWGKWSIHSILSNLKAYNT